LIGLHLFFNRLYVEEDLIRTSFVSVSIHLLHYFT